MDWTTATVPLSALDVTAFVFLVASWIGIGMVIDFSLVGRTPVSALMSEYRREWMRHAITREPRVFDAMIMTNLRESTAFFASACMIAIGGGLALIGNLESLTGLAQDLSLNPTPKIVWEIKILVVLLLITNAFLKFVWSNRIYGYCSVLLGAIPNTIDDPVALHRADQAAELNIVAARAFARGLRSVYFALGALTWLAGALPLIFGVLATILLISRREFASRSRQVLVQRNPQ